MFTGGWTCCHQWHLLDTKASFWIGFYQLSRHKFTVNATSAFQRTSPTILSLCKSPSRCPTTVGGQGKNNTRSRVHHSSKENMYPNVLHTSSCQSWVVPWQDVQLQQTSQSGMFGAFGGELIRCAFSECSRCSFSSATFWPCCLVATRCHAVATAAEGVFGNSGTNCSRYGLLVGFTQRLAF